MGSEAERRDRPRGIGNAEWAMLVLLIGASILFRFARLDGPLDEPSWRQAWCAYQARQLARESPPEFMHTKINYKGTNDVSVWNFPVYEGLVGMVYKVAGSEVLWLARLVTLIFFAGSAWYLYRFTHLFLGRRIALYALAMYWCIPLGVFYSRAVHYDPTVLFLAHAFLFHASRFFVRRKWSDYLCGLIAASLGFLIKPPYLIPVSAALGAWVLVHLSRKRLWDVVLCGLLFVPPLLLGWWFHHYRLGLEGHVASSLLYPDPYTKDYARSFYFGTLAQRMDLARWMLLMRNVLWLVVTPFGAFAVLWTLLSVPRRESWRSWSVVASISAGVAGYALLLFPIVASHHDYYLLPMMTPAAILLGGFLASLVDEAEDGAQYIRALIRICLSLALFCGGGIMGMRRAGYFRRDWQRIEAGHAINRLTHPDALVVSTAVGRSTGATDPRILYFADRRGWAVSAGDLIPTTIELYSEAGARHVAALVAGGHDAVPELFPSLEGIAWRLAPLKSPDGREIGALLMFDLGRKGGAPQ